MAQEGHIEVRVGPQGRVVIPSLLRKPLAVHPGDTLLARVEDGKLVLGKRVAILERVKARYKKVPPETSLVEDLLTERRAEARHEKGQ